MLTLTREKLDPLREALRERGARPSVVLAIPASGPKAVNAQEIGRAHV